MTLEHGTTQEFLAQLSKEKPQLIDGHVYTAPDGCKGFDCNRIVTAADAVNAKEAKYDFAMRYVKRSTKHAYDLTQAEVETILAAKLGVGVVQHVADPGWKPNVNSGRLYGTTAGLETEACGIKPGVNAWCDLEGVAAHDPAHPKLPYPTKDILAFLASWFKAVSFSGFLPGCYVGDSCGLSAQQLYDHTPFTHWWSAYNLNADRIPAVRGVQMRQHAAKQSELLPGFTNDDFDTDVIHTDALGGRPTFFAAEGWLTTLAAK